MMVDDKRVQRELLMSAGEVSWSRIVDRYVHYSPLGASGCLLPSLRGGVRVGGWGRGGSFVKLQS